MLYIFKRYRGDPDTVVDVVATGDPTEAVALVRRWSQHDAQEGLLLAVGDAVVLHCPPKHG